MAPHKASGPALCPLALFCTIHLEVSAMIEAWKKSRTPELKKLLKQLDDHTPSNPDDDPDLTGPDFLAATDDKTRELVEQIVDVGRIALFDISGRKQGQTARALRLAGNPVQVVGDPNDEDDGYKTTLEIETKHGRVQIGAPLLGR